MFLFGKKKKVQKELEQKFQDFEMSFENNYKDLAMLHLKEYDEMLEQYHEASQIDEAFYKSKKELVQQRQEKLKNFNHKQHIGW